MTIILRETVHYNHATVSSIEQEPFFITFPIALWTKNAAVGPLTQNIVHSPRRPKILHGSSPFLYNKGQTRFSYLPEENFLRVYQHLPKIQVLCRFKIADW